VCSIEDIMGQTWTECVRGRAKPIKNNDSAFEINNLPVGQTEQIGRELDSVKSKDFEVTRFGVTNVLGVRLAELWDAY